MSSVATTERLTAEGHHRMVQRYTQCMVDAVARYEGAVTQFRGDGIMALFGAPVAHEDSARRAVSAALAMRDALDALAIEARSNGQAAFAYRIGINTGPVIVGRIGDDDSVDYTAVGDTVNLASRMEQWAPPGRIYITDNTQRHIAAYFELRDLGQLEVKGKAELVRAFEVVRELPYRTRLDASLERGLTPYVGRERELGTLLGFYEQAARGRGQAVFISGEAGIGKSRLLYEFRRRLPAEARFVEGHCISYGAGIPYLPIIDIVRALVGVEEGTSAAAVAERIEATASRWSADARRSAPHLGFLLNVEGADGGSVDAASRRAGLIDAVRALVLHESRERPLVLVVEDLHWVDQMSEYALAALVDVIATAPVLLVLTYRPGYAHSLGERTYYSRIALQSFPSDESEALVQRVMQTSDLPVQLRTAIIRRAEGNPFFIEEVAKSLIESGAVRRENGRCLLVKPIEEVRIPDTVQEVILTRIDRLEQDAREAIQLASVIGREFTVRLLERLSETNARLEGVLADLKALELIFEKEYFPELSYMFKHALTHEVALSTLLTERRRLLHRLVAGAIEELYADRLAQQYEVLAHHYYEGADWERALDYLLKAGDKARDAFANQDAIAFYDRAAAIVEAGHIGGDTAPIIARARAGRGACLYQAGKWQEARDELTAALEEDAPDSEERAELFLDLAQACFWLLDTAAAREFGSRGGDIAKRVGAKLQMITARALVGSLGAADGDIESALQAYNEALAALDREEVRGMPPRLVDHYSLLAYWIGNTGDAVRRAQANVALEKELNDIQNLMQGLPHLGLSLAAAGRYEEALAAFDESRAVGERWDVKTLMARGICMSAGMLGDLYDFETALLRSREANEMARSVSFHPPIVSSTIDLLVTHARLGDLGQADALAGDVAAAVSTASGWHEWLWRLRLSEAEAEVALVRGDADAAIELALATVEQCVPKQRRKYEALGHLTHARALIAKARHREAVAPVATAGRLARDIDDPALIVRVAAVAAAVDGEENVRAGKAAIDRILLHLPAGTTRAAFENSEAVRTIRAAAR